MLHAAVASYACVVRNRHELNYEEVCISCSHGCN
jgi:hypothetical protein